MAVVNEDGMTGADGWVVGKLIVIEGGVAGG